MLHELQMLCPDCERKGCPRCNGTGLVSYEWHDRSQPPPPGALRNASIKRYEVEADNLKFRVYELHGEAVMIPWHYGVIR